MAKKPSAIPNLPPPVPMIGDQPAWREILRQNKYPTEVVIIDFETYFDADYHLMGKGNSGLSTIEFIMDDRFEEMGASIVHMKQAFEPVAPHFWSDKGLDAYIRYLQDEYGSNLEGCTVAAFNAPFDGTILKRRRGIEPPHFIDILGLARHEHSRDLNDLGALAERFGLKPKGDTSQFKGVHLKPKWDRTPGKPPRMIHPGITPEQMEALSIYACDDGEIEWELFIRLLPRLSNTAKELALMRHTLDIFLNPTLVVDIPAAEGLKVKMRERITEAVQVTGATEEEISGNISFSALLDTALSEAGDTIANYQKLGKPNKDGTPKLLLAIAKADDQLEELQNHGSQRVRQLMKARTAIKSWPLHISRVDRIVAQAGAAGGLMCVPLKYCGAHTGRWSGGEKINLQNLGSRGDELVTMIRYLLTAPEDHSLVIVDASQIEGRVLTWIAGQEDWNEMWRDPTRDPYCEFASKMAGRTVVNTKKVKQAIKALKAWHDRMRGMGKVGVLGCGYGMGWEKAIAYASNGYDVDMLPTEAQNLVKVYRDSVPKVTKFWRVVEQKFKAAARYHEPSTMDRGLSFHYEEQGDLTIITLPNGRTLKYPHVRVSIIDGREQMWMPNPMKPGSRTYMWGGFLTENIVQAISRDILAEAILECERRGYRVAHHVHDEVVAVVKTAVSKAVLGDVIQILSTAPAWAPDCPLAAEGKISQRYEK